MWRFRALCLNISVAGEKHSLVLLFILKRHTASLLPHLVIVITVKRLPMLIRRGHWSYFSMARMSTFFKHIHIPLPSDYPSMSITIFSEATRSVVHCFSLSICSNSFFNLFLNQLPFLLESNSNDYQWSLYILT